MKQYEHQHISGVNNLLTIVAEDDEDAVNKLFDRVKDPDDWELINILDL